MSVPPGDRNKSPMQFVETADKIETRAMQICRRWPKSWMFFITLQTVRLASEIYEHALKANAIYPITTEREREHRLYELQTALGANYAFARKIERAFQLFPICGEKARQTPAAANTKSMGVLQELMTLCMEEEDALKGNISYTRKADISPNKCETVNDTKAQ